MTEFQSASNCPNCGSPLDVKPGDTRVKCAYCGSSIVVSEHENSTPEVPQYTLKIDDQVAHEIGTVGKVAGGIAITSIILPLVITVVVLCGVGVILFFVFSNVNSAVKNISALPPSTSVLLPTPFPTATPEPTPTTAPTDTLFPTPVPFGNVLFQDNFSSTTSGWDQVHEADYTLEYKNGAYHVLVGAQNGGESVWIGDHYADVSVEVDVDQTAGPQDALAGVSCRYAQGAGGYTFEFSGNGTYGIYRYDKGSPSALDEAVLDPNTVNLSGTNHIEGVCSGSTLTLILNGATLMQVDDPTYTSGGAGLIVRTGDSGTAGVDVLFTKFLVKGP
jgi:LSD1 subclass zinc finger protein